MRGDSKAARIKRVRTVLSAFHKLSEEEAKNLLYFINDSGIQTLCEALYNSLYAPLDIANKDRKKLLKLFLPRMKVLKKSCPASDSRSVQTQTATKRSWHYNCISR